MDPQYYIQNNPFKKPPRNNTQVKATAGVLLVLGALAFWVMDYGAKEAQLGVSASRTEAPRTLVPLISAPLEPGTTGGLVAGGNPGGTSSPPAGGTAGGNESSAGTEAASAPTAAASAPALELASNASNTSVVNRTVTRR